LGLEFVSSPFDDTGTGREGPSEPIPEVGVDFLWPLHVRPMGSRDGLSDANKENDDHDVRRDPPLPPTGERTTLIWRFAKQRSSQQRSPGGICEIGRTGGEPEGAYLARIYCQRGNSDGECTTVVSYLPGEVAVLRRARYQRSHPGGDEKEDYSMLVKLETLLETGPGKLIHHVILLRPRQQGASGQLWKS